MSEKSKSSEKVYLEALLPYCNIPAICYDLRWASRKREGLSMADRLLMERAANAVELLSNRLIERTESLVNQWKK